MTEISHTPNQSLFNEIRMQILQEQRADYGKQVIAGFSEQLTREYGKGWSAK